METETKYPVLIIEVPHTLKPIGYLLNNEREFTDHLSAIVEEADKGDWEDYSELGLLEFAERDLSAMPVLRGWDEIREYRRDVAQRRGHQWMAICAIIDKELTD